MKKVIALLLIFAMCFSFVACESKNKRDKDLCSYCMDKMIGEWFYIDKYGDLGEENTLHTFSITKEGKLITDEGEYTLKFRNCEKAYHNTAYAYDDDGNQIFGLYHSFDYAESIEQQGLSIWSVENSIGQYNFRSMSKYTIVEITEENWQEYFSAEINETFNVNYQLFVNKDTWGEITDGNIQQDFVLKDYEKYSGGTQLAIEYSYETGDVYCEFDVIEEKVTKYNFAKAGKEIKTETQVIEYLENYNYANGMNITNGHVHLEKEEILKGSAEESWCTNPKEILRMKGWLVIKNDA